MGRTRRTARSHYNGWFGVAHWCAWDCFAFNCAGLAAVAWGSLLVAAGCDTATDEQQGHKQVIWDAAADGHYVVIADDVGSLGTWDLHSDEVRWKKQQLAGETLWLTPLPGDEGVVFACSGDGDDLHEVVRAQLIDAAELTVRWQREMAAARISAVAKDTFAMFKTIREGQPDAVAAIELWDMKQAKPRSIATIQDENNGASIYALAALDGDQILVRRMAGDNETWKNKLAVFDIDSRSIVHESVTQLDPKSIWVSASSYESRFAAIAGAGRIQLWSIPGLECRGDISFKPPHDVGVCAVSADGRYVAFGLQRLEVWDTQTDEIHLIDKLSEDVFESKQSLSETSDWGEDMFTSRMYCLASVGFFKDSSQGFAVTRDGQALTFDAAMNKVLRRRTISVVPRLERARERAQAER